MEEFIIQTEELTKDYSSWLRKTPRPALDRLTISIPKNCIFGFLGPNGAGKTTTIKILMGLIRPTGGKATVLGKPYDDVATEFLDVCARLLKIPGERRKKRIEEVLEIVRMTQHAKSKIGTFSRGMLQRIGIAQAILNDPELLILDEPLLGLDPYGRQEFKEIILGQKRDFHASVFFSSHILSDVEEICDCISILNKGRLLCSGPLQTLLSGGGKGVTVDVRSEDALRELVVFAKQTNRIADGEWELLFEQKDPAVEAKINELVGRFGDRVQIRNANEELESFFFKKIEQDNAAKMN